MTEYFLQQKKKLRDIKKEDEPILADMSKMQGAGNCK